ncbi:hypothetical protein QAD02_022538 [Eretmocerus hayati]|uniref:Uncharacterized protein n=1 Tax=Eretmocerus hayati TaxID=131215 RepID=A0ACC2PTV5_9HYME|nr:hypothetical protein QAD02_022538 [Eretmocerus hayati]
MRLFKGLFIVCAAGFAVGDIEDDYRREEVVPSILSKAPSQWLEVTYNGKSLQFGHELTPFEVKDEPDIKWNFDPAKLYTLIEMNPDSPNRANPIYRDGLHWLMVNIPGDDIKKGESIVDYMGSGPPKGDGLHRYMFLVYEQPGRITTDEKHIGGLQLEGRLKFPTQSFLDKYGLGDPIAGNMFQAQFDDYVPEFYKKIGILIYGCSLTLADVASDFERTEVVPDVLDKAPNQLLSVFYHGKQVQFEEEWTPTNVKEVPSIEWSYDPSSFYTLIMTNIDPLSRQRPIYREFLHWMVVNIPGDDFNQGETLVDYAGVGPPEGEGFHRIVFTLWKQPGRLEFNEPHTLRRQLGIRLKFSQRRFSVKYGLGDPIAGVMFIAQFDDYVPTLIAEFMEGARARK